MKAMVSMWTCDRLLGSQFGCFRTLSYTQYEYILVGMQPAYTGRLKSFTSEVLKGFHLIMKKVQIFVISAQFCIQVCDTSERPIKKHFRGGIVQIFTTLLGFH